jgi:DNA mismatch repair ATPase MutS
MKAFLMHKERNFDPQAKSPANAPDLIKDLELDTLVRAMAADDEFLSKISMNAVLQASDSDIETVLYRQAVLKDCLKNPRIARALYSVTLDALEAEKLHSWAYLNNYPAGILHRSMEILQKLIHVLEDLRAIAEKHAADFSSEGFVALFSTLRSELDDSYFDQMREHLHNLQFRDGVLIGAQLGKGNKGSRYVILKSNEKPRNWLERMLPQQRSGYTFKLHPRDEGGARALSEINDKGIGLVANALAQSTDHIVSFFSMLRTELAFYMGCLNLHDQLIGRKLPCAFPVPTEGSQRNHRYEGLYDPCLALRMDGIVPSSGNLDGKSLAIITGANQGGKSTFLRSIGLSQLMMQTGMFAPARALTANLSNGVFTHYKREEDIGMKSGKLDEELNRMSRLIDLLKADSIVLFNESFAATNEREGSEIAGEIVSALLANKIEVFFVTHMFEFANDFYEIKREDAFFLRAERLKDGTRSFQIVEGRPLRTSFGPDLYSKVFADVPLGEAAE